MPHHVMKPQSAERPRWPGSGIAAEIRRRPTDRRRSPVSLETAQNRASAYLRWINASDGDEVYLLPVEAILYFQSDSKYTRVVTCDRECYIRRSILDLAGELDPGEFRQVHRATIVNLKAVDSVGRDPGNHVFLRLKGRAECLPVSQPFSHLFRPM